MALLYQPRLGSLFYCDFTGFKEPEMVKRRPVVVVAKHPHNTQLVVVIPLSTSHPKRIEAYHYEFPTDPCPDGTDMRSVWAKCDMVYTVSIARLDSFYKATRRGRERIDAQVEATDFAAIKNKLANFLGLTDNDVVPARGFESEST